MSPTCRRHRQMSPNLGRHCVSLRHRRGPDIPNLCQLQPTSTSQPKRTSTLAIIEFLCLSSNNNFPDMSSNVVSFRHSSRHDIFLCLRHDQRRVTTCRRHDTECRRLGNKNDTPTSDITGDGSYGRCWSVMAESVEFLFILWMGCLKLFPLLICFVLR